MSSTDNTAKRDREYVDDRDLARLTPISRSHWQTLRTNREGPPWSKIGRRVVYRWADVAAWIEAQKPANDSAGSP